MGIIADTGTRNFTGQKIRAYRVKKGITVEELSKACGVNNSCIRNWERGYRQVSEDKLLLLAQRLEVSVAALRDRYLDSLDDVMQTLFELASKYALTPIHLSEVSNSVLMTNDPALGEEINNWEALRKKGSTEDLEEWMYSPKTGVSRYGIESNTSENTESVYTDNIKVILLSSALIDTLLILNDHFELILNNIRKSGKKDQGLAIHQLEVLQKTLQVTINRALRDFR